MTITRSYNRCESLALQSPNLEHPYLCNPQANHFFFPNEVFPKNISPHYVNREDGIHIATGAERFFFNAITCRPRDLFLNIDLDSHIKAYVDLNILFLIISDSQEEYIRLIEKSDNCEVFNKIDESPYLSEQWKSYYREHLTAYSKIFYKNKQLFFFRTFGNYKIFPIERRSITYTEPLIAYHKLEHKDDFNKLQRLAREGKLLSVCRSITDLTFINWQEIAEIDTSNIEDYAPLHFHFDSIPTSPIRIIRAPGFGSDTRFASWLYTPLSEEKRRELETLQNRVFKADKNSSSTDSLNGQYRFIAAIAEQVMEKAPPAWECQTNSPSRMSDCISVLPLWEEFVNTYLIGDQQLGEFLCIPGCFDLERFEKLDATQINNYFKAHTPSPKATDFLVHIGAHLRFTTHKTNENNPDALQHGAPAA